MRFSDIGDFGNNKWKESIIGHFKTVCTIGFLFIVYVLSELFEKAFLMTMGGIALLAFAIVVYMLVHRIVNGE